MLLNEWVAFGAALDPLDAPEKVEMKVAYLRAVGRGALKPGHPRDPYDLIAAQVLEAGGGRVLAAGKLEVEDWLKPRPAPRSLPSLRRERFTGFLDADGCRRYAGMVGEYLEAEVFPRRPLMIGVDHSLSGGALRSLAERYGPDRLAVVVMDAHSDVLSLQERMELYNRLERDGRGLDTAGSQAANRTASVPDSYNCGSFLHFLVEEGVVEPAGLLLAGVADQPSAGSGTAGAGPVPEPFAGLQERGASFLGREALRAPDGPARLREALERLEGRTAYVSLDVDVGALEAAHACRFMDLFGLGEKDLLAACEVLGGWLGEEKGRLAGLDLMEMDVHLAGLRHADGTRDHTARLAVRMLSRLL
jgi:arginase family enzyme